MSVIIKGLQSAINKLKRSDGKAEKALGAALKLEAEFIMTDSKKNYTPVDTGTLRSSGFVENPKKGFRKVSVTMGYGGAAKDYALTVHEGPNNKNWSVSGTGNKYLEKPVRKALPTLATKIARRINDQVI